MTDLSPDLPAGKNFYADEDKLNQIFSNLLGNAIKYSPDGGTISVTALVEAGNVVVHIKDSGVGMTQEQCGRLFRQYERLDRDSIKNIPGTGLGLYLTKILVDLHGGEVFCDSVQGEGSTFTVRLPIQQPPA